jgi:formyltetrahydrofolate-dependent phosphoribosylglycinamide formyltransferase
MGLMGASYAQRLSDQKETVYGFARRQESIDYAIAHRMIADGTITMSDGLLSRCDTVVLAGFMRIVKPALLAAFPMRVLNIHPALLPAFPGVHSWTQALDYGCKVAGVTVHFVDAGTDSGPIIVQKCVPVLEDDTPETLHARIQVQEHMAFPEALRLLAAGRLRVEGRRVIVASE